MTNGREVAGRETRRVFSGTGYHCSDQSLGTRAQCGSSCQTSTPRGDSVHLDPRMLKLLTARSFCSGPSPSASSNNGIISTIANTLCLTICQTQFQKQGVRTHLPLPTAPEVRNVMSILEMRKLRHRELKQLAQGHTATK